jgi:predicted RNA-binding protein with PUA-like domain
MRWVLRVAHPTGTCLNPTYKEMAKVLLITIGYLLPPKTPKNPVSFSNAHDKWCFMKYWLMKSEPDVYSITDLKRDRASLWDGVRNYQARNFLREMKIGDYAFFYHSNTKPPGIVGLMQIIETDIADPTQFEQNSEYYDPKSSQNAPRWQTVKVEFQEEFQQLISLEKLKRNFRDDELLVVKKGNRLSVIPIEYQVAQRILAMKEKG